MIFMKWIKRRAKLEINKNDLPIDRIAKIRGIEDVDSFLKPNKDELHNPYLMKGIEDVSNRIIRAIKGNEKIVVSYDCDADGITSGTIMRRYLNNYTDNVDFIYGERSSGHGITEQLRNISKDEDEERHELNKSNVKKVVDADLLIIVDSSTNDVEICNNIVNENTDVIIIDHHLQERDNPNVLMVNPQQENCNYPNKNLSGAGVVFKVLQVMEDTLEGVDIWQYIDLVAVGIYADLMPLNVLENRYLIMHGLRNMKNTGLVRILKGGNADFYKLNGDSIGFIIAPMLNGSARMNRIKLAIDILMSDDDKVCRKLRLQMRDLNEERKELQKEATERYSHKIDLSKKAIFISDEESSRGFNGLVAQDLSSRYKKPVIIGGVYNNIFSGSFRSYGGFKLKSFLSKFDGDIEVLGHEGAGGIILEESLIDDLIDYMDDFLPQPEDLENVIYYDLEIDVSEIQEYVKVLEQYNLLAGSQFPKIIVKVNGITVDKAECIGKTKETVKITTLDSLELIKFKVNDKYASELGVYDEVNVVGELGLNEFYHWGLKKKIVTPQVKLEDYKVL